MKRQERVQRRLNRIADGEHFDRGLCYEESAAETGDHLFWTRLSREGLQRVVLAIENVRHAAEPGLRHDRRRYAVTGAHSGKVERFFNMLEVAFPTPDSRYLLRGIRQRVSHSIFVKPRERRCGPHGAERR